MSVLSLCRHVVDIFRSTETRGATLRQVVRTWAENVADVTCEIQKAPGDRSQGQRTDVGPGEISQGDWLVFIPDVTVDVLEGDIIQSDSGDNHPKTLEVQFISDQRANHLQCWCDVWEGSLT